MLVVSRKCGERLVVPNCNLVVTVLATKRKTVRLGISAPENLAVFREEVWAQLSEKASLRRTMRAGKKTMCAK